MERKGLIKAFSQNVTKIKKIIGKSIPKHLDINFPIKKTILSIVSTSNKDSIENEGAFALIIDGLNEDYIEQSEIIKLNGKNPQYSKKEFMRINNVVVVECGKLRKNAGNIYITSFDDIIINGIPQKNLYHTIGKGENMSCCGIYSVPKGYSMQFTQYNITSKIGFFGTIINNNYISVPNFSEMEIVEVYCNHFQQNINYPVKYATPIGEKSDLIIKARTEGLFFFSKACFGCYFQFVLILNKPEKEEDINPIDSFYH